MSQDHIYWHDVQEHVVNQLTWHANTHEEGTAEGHYVDERVVS